MRNGTLARAGAPAGLLVLIGVLLFTGLPQAAAQQSERGAPPEIDTVPFGVLGPVGIVAIVLGLLGMVAGIVRQRRRTRVVTGAEHADSVGAEEQTRPMLTPVDS